VKTPASGNRTGVFLFQFPFQRISRKALDDHPQRRDRILPIIGGHRAAGVARQIISDVRALRVGAPVSRLRGVPERMEVDAFALDPEPFDELA
jgi:hypothetical protein